MISSGVYVVSAYGSSGALGVCVPRVGMMLNTGNFLGTVVDVSGNLILFASGIQAYDFECQLSSGIAISNYNWPLASGFRFGHTGVFPQGNVFNVPAATGFAYTNGNTVFTFGR